MAWDDPYDSGLISSIDPRIQSNPFIDEAAGLRIQNQYLDQQRGQQQPQQTQQQGGWGQALTQEAERNGLDPDVLQRIIKIESGGDPNNRTGSYGGLFQLSKQEFNKYGGGNIFDPTDNIRAGTAKLAAERDNFKEKYGRDPTATDLYLTHQQGEGGYGQHMANPDRPAWENMFNTGEGRQKGAGWAKQAIWGNIPDQYKKQFGSVDNVTSADFVNMWRNKVEGDNPGATPDTRNYGSVAAALGRQRMDDTQQQPPGNPLQNLFPGLFGGGQGGQGQQQQGGQQPGLLGALSDPTTMAYLGMMTKALSPYSNVDPTAMLKNAQLQQQHQQDLALKQRAQTFDESQTGVTNAFKERQLAQQGETDASRTMKDMGLTPGTPEYKKGITDYYRSKMGETWKPVTIEGPNGEKQTVFQNPQGEVRRPEQMPGYTPSTDTGGNPYSASGKMSTDEGKAALFADRAANAHADITKYENINNQPGGTVGALIQQNAYPGLANAVVSGARGQAMDAQRSFINALLRRESGAAISAGEYDSYGKEYFPQYGDTKDQIDAKRTRRASVIAGLAREGGRGYRPSYSFDESGNITLGKPSYTGKGQSAAPMEGAKQAKDGNWYVQQNGKYFRVDQ